MIKHFPLHIEVQITYKKLHITWN